MLRWGECRASCNSTYRIRKLPDNYVSYALCGTSIPERRHSSSLGFTGEDEGQLCAQTLRAAPHENIRAHGNRDGALRVVAHSQTGHAEVRRFFLNTPRVRDHHRGPALQGEEFQVRNGIQNPETLRVQAQFSNSPAGAR